MEKERENLKETTEALEKERIRRATEEIEAVLQKYGVKLQAFAEIPATGIKIVLDR